jgi:hypothetical protein
VRWSFVDTSVNISAAADTRSWHEVFSDSLTKSAEYRPLLDLGTRVAYRVLGLDLSAYKILVVLQCFLVLLALTAMFRASGWRRVTAATIALSIVVGLHTSRVLFLFVPLNAYALSILIVLLVALMTMTPHLRRYEWALLPLTLIALLWLELGIFIVPLVAVAWLMKAPGVTWRSLAASVVGLAIYLTARLGFSTGGVPLDSPETGLGFASISPDESATLFVNAPWLFWLHNIAATLMTVLVSEPRAGRFQFIEAVLRGQVPPWMWLHVLSSIATTAVVAVVLLGIRARPHRDRLIAAFGGVLVVGGSLLGYLYTRDRIGLPVGLGYAMMAYVAVSAILERSAPKWQALSGRLLVIVLGLCWLLRSGDLYVALRDTAWEYHLQWTREDVIAAAERNPLLGNLRASALKRSPPDVRRDPAWTYKLFERQYAPLVAEPQP